MGKVPREVVAFGRKVAAERQRVGLTQQRLAERVALSRAGLSHIEGGLALASERTVTLLAGVFGVDPPALADGTDYPVAKVERLPLTAARYTEADLQLRLLERDLAWCNEVAQAENVARRTIVEWRATLESLLAVTLDPGDRSRVSEALRQLRKR